MSELVITSFQVILCLLLWKTLQKQAQNKQRHEGFLEEELNDIKNKLEQIEKTLDETICLKSQGGREQGIAQEQPTTNIEQEITIEKKIPLGKSPIEKFEFSEVTLQEEGIPLEIKIIPPPETPQRFELENQTSDDSIIATHKKS